jgi:dihydrofolate synthase/folylpolyglutamate synthase
LSHNTWQWSNEHTQLTLANPLLQGDFQFNNAAGVVAVVQTLQSTLPVSPAQISLGLTTTTLSGRLQSVMHQGHTWLLDIAHNPQSIRSLVTYLEQEKRPIHLVFSALGDKDVAQMLALLKDCVHAWWIAPLQAPRAATLAELKSAGEQVGLAQVTWCDSIADACCSAQLSAQQDDVLLDVLLVACGSFLTVEQVGDWLGVNL